MTWVPAGAVVVAVALALAAWLEAGRLRTTVVEVRLPALPAELDGIRIGHLSDFHFGAPLSRGNRAGMRAAAWVGARAPDLVCVTGDLLSHHRGASRLAAALRDLDHPFVVLGNHDVRETRDPFSRLHGQLELGEGVVLLRDAAAAVELRGTTVQLVGVDPVTYRAGAAHPWTLADPGVRLRILLCHFPAVVRVLPASVFDLVLVGHLHAGQLCLPLPGGRRLTLAHPRARYVAGLYRTPGGCMHVSPGTGTTFVPFRAFARPEVTELVLRRDSPGVTDTVPSPRLRRSRGRS